MNGTGKVSFARKTRRHATGPAVRTGAGGAGNMRVGGPGVRSWCAGVWVLGCPGGRRRTGGRPFLLPWLHRDAKEDDEGRRPFLIRWRVGMLARGCVGDYVRVLISGVYNIFFENKLYLICILRIYVVYLHTDKTKQVITF
jgi:hypothetical protein